MQIRSHGIASLSLALAASCALAQDEIAPTPFDPLVWADVRVAVDSGRHIGGEEVGRTAWHTLVQSPGATWIRLEFGKDTELAQEL